MKTKNQTQKISNIRDLKLNQNYFSRFMSVNFTVININQDQRKIMLGINDSIKTVDFLKFNRAYFKEGIISIN